ncbi:MAG: hypothetical protein ACP5E4_03215 [Candidatus Aenigmatarchaeota archaeon]
MVEQEVETISPWLAVIIIATIIALLIVLLVSGDMIRLLVFPRAGV